MKVSEASETGVIDADARTFVQDLDAEDLGRAHRAVLIAPESESRSALVRSGVARIVGLLLITQLLTELIFGVE